MKCIPHLILQNAKGNILHDSHAEILAIRAFNRYLLQQCMNVIKQKETDNHSSIIESTKDSIKQFKIRKEIKLHMYCSECPCGDASMELVMSRQEDATPWTRQQSEDTERSVKLMGRGYFDQLGCVRRKPARADAPISFSKSCSDKIALRQYLSLLSCIPAMFIESENAYLDSIIIPKRDYIDSAVKRAFHTRISSMHKIGPYDLHELLVRTTESEFKFSRTPDDSQQPRPSNHGCIVVGDGFEVIINGVLQGYKQTNARAASFISRRFMWALGIDLSNEIQSDIDIKNSLSYKEIKNCKVLAERRLAKKAVTEQCLIPWIRNEVDDEWICNQPNILIREAVNYTNN